MWDDTSPTVSNVTSTKTDGSYKAGVDINIAIEFSEPVYVTGTPLLFLETGTTDRNAIYVDGNATSTLTFTYTVETGDISSDLDYNGTDALILNGGTITDVLLNDANLALFLPGAIGSLGTNKAIVIDTTAPTVSNVTSTKANGTYKAGADINITVEFSQAVHVTGTPLLFLETGTTDRNAIYVDGNATSTLTFTYTVQAGDTSSDLDYNGTDALEFNSGTIKDVAGNDANLTLATPGASGSLGASKVILIDTTAPIINSVISDANSSGVLKIGNTITFTVDINVMDTNLTILPITYNGGDLNWSTSDSGDTYTAVYTIVAGQDTNTPIQLIGVTATDAVGNISIDVNSTDVNKTIDATRPTVAITMSDYALKVGDTSTVTFTFSEAPTGFVKADDVNVQNGTLGDINSDNPIVQTATFTPTDDLEDAINVITVGNGWTDTAGNAPASDSNSLNYVIDTKEPTLTITMDTTSFILGNTATVTFTFSEAPTGFTKTDDITVQNGTLGNINSDNPLVQTAVFTPTNGILDTVNIITVAVTWTDASGNAPINDSNSPNYTIDTRSSGGGSSNNGGSGGTSTVHDTNTEDDTNTTGTGTGTDTNTGTNLPPVIPSLVTGTEREEVLSQADLNTLFGSGVIEANLIVNSLYSETNILTSEEIGTMIGNLSRENQNLVNNLLANHANENVQVTTNLQSYEIKDVSGVTRIVSRITITITALDDLGQVTYIEEIPKTIAADIAELTFNISPTQILNADPVVLFTFNNLAKGTTKEIVYMVNKNIQTLRDNSYFSAGTIVTTPDTTPYTDATPDSKNYTWVYVVVIVLAILLVVLIAMFISKKKKHHRL